MATKQRRRDAEYFLSLRYPIVVRELAPDEGGGYMATIPQLGSQTFVGDGETTDEAIAALLDLKQRLIPYLVEKGVKIPEPVVEEDEDQHPYSGHLMLRIPRGLHAQLAETAKRNDCSINKLATQLLAERLERFNLMDEVRTALRSELRLSAPDPRASHPMTYTMEGGTYPLHRLVDQSGTKNYERVS